MRRKACCGASRVITTGAEGERAPTVGALGDAGAIADTKKSKTHRSHAPALVVIHKYLRDAVVLAGMPEPRHRDVKLSAGMSR